MKTLTISLSIVMLIISGTMQAGFLQTVAEMPEKAVEATATVAKDVVTAPDQIVQDVVTAPAKVVGAVPEKERTEEITGEQEVLQSKASPAEAKAEMTISPEEQKLEQPIVKEFVVEEAEDINEPSKELAE